MVQIPNIQQGNSFGPFQYQTTLLFRSPKDHNHSKARGPDSPTLKLCYLSFIWVTFRLQTLLEEKTVIVDFGESQPSGRPGIEK